MRISVTFCFDYHKVFSYSKSFEIFLKTLLPVCVSKKNILILPEQFLSPETIFQCAQWFRIDANLPGFLPATVVITVFRLSI